MTQTVEKKKTLTKSECARIYKKAHEAGLIAGETAGVIPMIVGQPSTPFGNDVDYSKPTYFVEGGVCGFAWIKISPARGAFVNYLKSIEVGSKSYTGGFDIWVRGFGQSLQRKEAYAQAFTEILRENGINAYAESRLD